MQSRMVPEDFTIKTFIPGTKREKVRLSSSAGSKNALSRESAQAGIRSSGARSPQVGSKSSRASSAVRRRSSSYTSSDNEDLRTDSESMIWKPGQTPTAKSVLRENLRLRHVIAESELQLARLTAQVATLQQREYDRAQWNGDELNVEKVWDPNDPVYGPPGRHDKDQSAMKTYQDRARAAEERLQAITQQQEITEETLHLHRRRVSKLYTKIDRLHRELQNSRDQAHRMELTLKKCEETDGTQKERIQELEEQLRQEREAHENLHQRFRATLDQDGKWRDRLAELSELLKGRVQAQEIPSWLWLSPPRGQEQPGQEAKTGALKHSGNDQNNTPSRHRAWESPAVPASTLVGREHPSTSTAFTWNNLNSGPRTPATAGPSVLWAGNDSTPDFKARSVYEVARGGGDSNLPAAKERDSGSPNLRTPTNAATHKRFNSAAGISTAFSKSVPSLGSGQDPSAGPRSAAWTPVGAGGGRSMAMHTSELDVLGGSTGHGTPTLNLGSPELASKLSRSAREAGSAASGARHGGADDELAWILRRFEVEQDSFRREMDSLKSLLDLRT